MKLTPDQTEAMQQTELEIFKVFISVCEKLNIKYYLIAGTLLGAVRHQGFIPWDDDIDVGIFREDYERFVAEAPALLPPHLFLQTRQSDPEYPHVFAKIRNSNTAFIETSVKKRKMNHGMFIDVFPIDGYSETKMHSFSAKVKSVLINSRISYAYDIAPSWKIRLIRPFSRLLYPSVSDALDAKERIFQSAPGSDLVANFSGIYGQREIMPADWYGNGAQLTFGDVTAKVPVEYHKWLTQVYGDYMQLPPEDKRATHHQTVCIDAQKSYLEYTHEV